MVNVFWDEYWTEELITEGKKGIKLLHYSFVFWESVLSLDGLYYNNNLPLEVDNKIHFATPYEPDCPS